MGSDLVPGTLEVVAEPSTVGDGLAVDDHAAVASRGRRGRRLGLSLKDVAGGFLVGLAARHGLSGGGQRVCQVVCRLGRRQRLRAAGRAVAQFRRRGSPAEAGRVAPGPSAQYLGLDVLADATEPPDGTCARKPTKSSHPAVVEQAVLRYILS